MNWVNHPIVCAINYRIDFEYLIDVKVLPL